MRLAAYIAVLQSLYVWGLMVYSGPERECCGFGDLSRTRRERGYDVCSIGRNCNGEYMRHTNVEENGVHIVFERNI